MRTDALKGLKGKTISEGSMASLKFDKTNFKFAKSVTEVVTANFKMTPTDAAKALMGATWATTIEINAGKEADWSKPLSLQTVCGTTANVGVHGTPAWDAANVKTTGCLAHTWTYNKKNCYDMLVL
ncbi:MAG: hypothetical protein CMA59_00770 [Euryarchaeota archaeon]|nr:hypothetical protein [Euryarchaeota archaeon]